MKNNYKYIKAGSVLSAILLLSGCGGGGGSSAATQPNFTNWSSISKPSQVNLEGVSTDSSYVFDGSKVTSTTSHGVDLTAAANVTYRADNTISKISFSTDNSGVTFDEDATDVIGNTGNTVYGYDLAGTKFLLAADPLTIGWNYQTFGIWETGRGTGSGTAGAISAGAVTLGSSIPTKDSATYNGHFGGVLSDFDGDDFLTRGSVVVGVNFADKELTFNTTSTQTLSPVASNPTWSTATAYNITPAANGTKLTYSDATNSFTGALKDGNNFTGTATGRFYGPNAEELGGVFNLSGSGLNNHAGAFGAKK